MKKIFYMLLISSLPITLVAQSSPSIIIKSPAWLIKGNSGTNPLVNFLGTKDAQPLVFRVNNQTSGYLDYDSLKGNAGFGFRALQLNTSIYNTAIGYKALSSNIGGQYNAANGAFALSANTYGLGNTANGAYALYSNSSGSFNTAIGEDAMYATTFGSNNVAIGNQAMVKNTFGSNNVAIGSLALNFSTASDNTALGANTLYDNTTGNSNVATGEYSLFINTSGNNNTATGNGSLFQNSTGNNNTAIGNSALFMNTIGSNNTAIGYNANVSFGNLTNATAIGYTAFVDSSNKVRLGNDQVSSIGGEVNWTNYAADNLKQNIKENVPGIQFIKALRPVTYNLNITNLRLSAGINNSSLNEKANKFLQSAKSITPDVNKQIGQIRFTGLIATEVDAAANKLHYNFSGVDKNGTTWGLRYAEFIMPLIKAVQELSKMNEDKDAQISELAARITKLEAMMNMQQSTAASPQNPMVKTHAAALEQNAPNPFSNTSVINYVLPDANASAKIIITDKSGKILKAMNISGNVKGSIKIDASDLGAGTYQYSLYINQELISSRQMVVSK